MSPLQASDLGVMEMCEELYVQEDCRRLAWRGTVFRCSIRRQGKRLYLVRLDELAKNGQREVKLFEERVGIFEAQSHMGGDAWAVYDSEVALSVGDRVVCTLVTDRFNQDQSIAGFGGFEKSFLAAIGRRRAFGNSNWPGYRMPELYDLKVGAEFMMVHPASSVISSQQDPRIGSSRVKITEIRTSATQDLDYVLYEYQDGLYGGYDGGAIPPADFLGKYSDSNTGDEGPYTFLVEEPVANDLAPGVVCPFCGVWLPGHTVPERCSAAHHKYEEQVSIT